MSFLVPGGANIVPVFFSSGCSRMGCSEPALVNELNEMAKNMSSSGSWPRLSWKMVVLAVPLTARRYLKVRMVFTSWNSSRLSMSRNMIAKTKMLQPYAVFMPRAITSRPTGSARTSTSRDLW